jgi:hypothetical protein
LGTENAIYHPMEGIDVRLAQLLPDMVLQASADTGVLNPVQLKSCALLILYTEFEQPALSDCETAALLSYVAEGGPVLIVHNGISVQNRSELAQLSAHGLPAIHLTRSCQKSIIMWKISPILSWKV